MKTMKLNSISLLFLLALAFESYGQGNIYRHEFNLVNSESGNNSQTLDSLDSSDTIVLKSMIQLYQANTLDSLFITLNTGDSAFEFSTALKLPETDTVIADSEFHFGRYSDWLLLEYGTLPYLKPFDVYARLKRTNGTFTQQHHFHYE